MILGNLLSDQLTWDANVSTILIPALKNQLRTLKLVNRYLGPGFKAIYTNAVFRSRIMFGLETWGGAAKTLRSKIQKLQDKASELALPRQYKFKSSSQRQKVLGWLSIEDEIYRSTCTLTYRILNEGIPQKMAELMPGNFKTLRIRDHKKLGTKPKWLGNNKLTKSLFRARAYYFNTLPPSITTLPNIKKFKKRN